MAGLSFPILRLRLTQPAQVLFHQGNARRREHLAEQLGSFFGPGRRQEYLPRPHHAAGAGFARAVPGGHGRRRLFQRTVTGQRGVGATGQPFAQGIAAGERQTQQQQQYRRGGEGTPAPLPGRWLRDRLELHRVAGGREGKRGRFPRVELAQPHAQFPGGRPRFAGVGELWRDAAGFRKVHRDPHAHCVEALPEAAHPDHPAAHAHADIVGRPRPGREIDHESGAGGRRRRGVQLQAVGTDVDDGARARRDFVPDPGEYGAALRPCARPGAAFNRQRL